VNYAIFTLETLVLITAVGRAFWQHRILRRYREADRRHEAEQIEQEKIQLERRERRASWEPAFRDADEILKRLRDIESEVRAQGPVDQDFVTRADLKRIQWQLENVADLCPETLHVPLRTVAGHVAKFSSVKFPSDSEVADGYSKAFTSTSQVAVSHEIVASQLGRRAIEQYGAAVELHEAITSALKAIHTERGGEP
jgi:hypothetical protein